LRGRESGYCRVLDSAIRHICRTCDRLFRLGRSSTGRCADWRRGQYRSRLRGQQCVSLSQGAPASAGVEVGAILHQELALRQPRNKSAQGNLLPPDGQAVAIPSTADLPCANAIAGAQDKERQGIRCVRLTVESSGADAPQKLARDDLKLSQGGRAMQILFFEQEPASVGILIDTSGSMDTKLQQAKNAIAQFVNDLNSRDDIFLFAFSSKPFLL
jgi:hypothetical protein